MLKTSPGAGVFLCESVAPVGTWYCWQAWGAMGVAHLSYWKP